jgi:hypothetical protein
MLTGDKVDNIKGIPKLPWHICKQYGTSMTGVGDKAAQKIMATTVGADDAEQLVYEMYMHWGLMEGYTDTMVKDYILEQGQLLWMTRELNEDGTPVLFQINERIYGQAREAVKDSSFPVVEAISGEGDESSEGRGFGYTEDSTEGWEAGDTLQSGGKLRIVPAGLSKGGIA